ncbi:hypothetical protein, partial [Escherichia coli]|uniref:hypothetical protein n=1 Tax=Escherichia coli TaxID=562 RepID=UPI00359452FF
ELRDAIKQLRTLDIDGDGEITLAEASPPGGPVALAGPQNGFANGQVPLQGGQGAVGLTANQQQMIGRMLQFDTNGDGLLSPD